MLKSVLLLASLYGCSATDYTSSSLSRTYIKTSKWSLKTDVQMSVEDNLVTVTLEGPVDKWYSVGFGNSKMDKAYCIVVDGYGEVTERYLTGVTAGDLLDSTWTVESNVESSHSRKVVLTRDYDYELSSSYYHQFTTSYSSLETIYAWGSHTDLDDHGETQRGSYKLSTKRSTSVLDAKKEEAELWGDASTNVVEEEYGAYLTTSSVLTWVTCIIAAAIIGWLIYQKWMKNQYNEIPDDCQSNINMVPMHSSVKRESAALV